MKPRSRQDQNLCLDPQDFTWDMFTRKAFTWWVSVLLVETSFIYFISIHSKRLYLLLNYLKPNSFSKSNELMIMDLTLQKPKSFYLHLWPSSLQGLEFLSRGWSNFHAWCLSGMWGNWHFWRMELRNLKKMGSWELICTFWLRLLSKTEHQENSFLP